MKNYLFLAIIYLTLIQPSISQNNPDVCTSCGPEGLENTRENIDNLKELEDPYNGIFHLRVTRFFFSTNVSTASFLDNDLVITANHNLMYSPFITKIEFYLNGEWIKINKRHLKIYHYHKSLFHKKIKDIAVIKIKNLNALKDVKHTNFILQDYDDIENKENLDFHLTGFPCDRPNILVDKKTISTELSINNTNKIIGYKKLYTCTGDSGAPLWFEINGKYYLTSIHHGGNDIGVFENESINLGIKINADLINWIDEMK
jgi:V8-like Glu-specific endopeptidase